MANQPDAFLEDLEFTDKLFDELLTELEFENYANNDFITFGGSEGAKEAPSNSSMNYPVQSNQTLLFGSANNNNTQMVPVPSLPAPGYQSYQNPTPAIPSLPSYSNYQTSEEVNSYSVPNYSQGTMESGSMYTQANYSVPPIQYDHRQFMFSVDLNAKIDEEIFKDEEADLFGPKYPANSSSYTNNPPQYQQQHQQPPHPVQFPDNATNVHHSYSSNIHSPSSLSNTVTPHTQSDDEFIIGAVTLAAKLSPNQPLHYNHHVVPSQRSSIKRKNKDISNTSTITSTSYTTTSTVPMNTNRAAIADSLMTSTISPNTSGKGSSPTTATTTATTINSTNPIVSNAAKKRYQQEYQFLLDFPVKLFQAFNGGDLSKVKEIIQEYTAPECTLKTPALDEAIAGQNYVIEFFQALSDAHPDAVLVAKKCQLIPTGDGSTSSSTSSHPQLQGRMYFAGTRIFKPQLSNVLDFNYHHSDYLFKRPNASLLDEMDTSHLSIQELSAMKELETRGKNLSIFGKGNIQFRLNTMKKIDQFHVDWTITSFREADL